MKATIAPILVLISIYVWDFNGFSYLAVAGTESEPSSIPLLQEVLVSGNVKEVKRDGSVVLENATVVESNGTIKIFEKLTMTIPPDQKKKIEKGVDIRASGYMAPNSDEVRTRKIVRPAQ